MVDVTKPIYGEIWANSGEKLSPGTDKIATGWIQEMMPYQYENFLQNRTDVAISYLLQKGIPEWSAEQEYTANKSVVTYSGQLYLATATTTNVLPTITASWRRLTITFGANGAIPVAFGGTGATNAADARTNLGIGSAATVNLPASNGVVVKLADNSLVARTISGTSGYITVSNGDGVAGNPTINVGTDVAKTDQDAAWTTKTSIKIPSGTTAERGVGAPGRIRFNMESGVYEGYDNTGWSPIGSNGTMDVQTFQGDGTTTSFTLSSTPRAENNTQVFFNGIYQQKNSYELVGNNLVFDEAPAVDISIEVVTIASVAIGTTTAAQSSITDSGNYYNSTNVEGALQELGARFNTVVTPEQFGAVGDFSVDDLPAVQGALSYLNTLGGGTLIAKGKYSLSRQLRTFNNVTIDMDNTGVFRRDFLTSPTGSGVISVNWGGAPSVNVTIKNGTIDGNGQNYYSGHNGFGCVDTTNLVIENVTFTNNVSAHGIDIAKVSGASIRNCKFLGYSDADGTRGFSEAIQLDPDLGAGGSTSYGIVISGCYCGRNPSNTDPRFGPWPSFVGNHAVNVAGSVITGVVISNNFSEDCTWSHISPFAWDNVSITNNTFKGGPRGVYMQQGTGTKLQGCIGVVIEGNQFIDVTLNTVFLSGSATNSVLHKNVVINSNIFKNNGVAGSAVLRVAQSENVVFTNNTVEGYALGVTTATSCSQSGITISGNNFRGVRGQIISLVGADTDVIVSYNNVSDFTGRFLHSNGATDASARGRILVSDNSLTDCSGAVFIAADSGATANFVVRGNSMTVGKQNMQPSSDELIRITTSGRSEVVDNYVADALIGKKVFVPNGIFKGRFAGTPEGVLTCGAGSVVLNSSGGAGTTMYIKESGTGNTGWVGK